jgi:hypothetical protein
MESRSVLNLQDRAHPLCYDGLFNDEVVSQVRRDGCLFLRKMNVRLATTTVSIRSYICVQVYREFKYEILAVSYSFQRDGVARK